MVQQPETVDRLIEKVNQKLLIAGQQSEAEKELKRSVATLRRQVSENTKVFSTLSLFNGGEKI